MSHGPNLNLSNKQTAIINAVADTIELNWRHTFLMNVQDRLVSVGQPTDRDVLHAVETAHAVLVFDDYSDCA